MIISKTPYRISFFGGGTDYPAWLDNNKGEVLSTTINKYIYLTCRLRERYFDKNFRIIWSKLENVPKITDIEHNAVRNIFINLKVNKPLELHYDGDMPAQSGVGSSSTFVVGLTHILYSIQGKKISKNFLAKKSIFFEQSILKETVGLQDQVAASYGGFNNIIFNKRNFTVKKFKFKENQKRKLNSNLIIMYLGHRKTTANQIAKSYINNLNLKKNHKKLISIYESVSIAKKLLLSGKLDDFGRLIGEVWEKKREIGDNISNNFIDNIYKNALRKGALGGKLLGAGGGGFFLFYVKKKKQSEFKHFFKKFIFTDFEFDNLGSQILYNDEKKIKF